MRKVNKIIAVFVLTIFLSLTIQAACADISIDNQSLVGGNITTVYPESKDEVFYGFLLPGRLIGLQGDFYATGSASNTLLEREAGESIYMMSEKNASHSP